MKGWGGGGRGRGVEGRRGAEGGGLGRETGEDQAREEGKPLGGKKGRRGGGGKKGTHV